MIKGYHRKIKKIKVKTGNDLLFFNIYGKIPNKNELKQFLANRPVKHNKTGTANFLLDGKYLATGIKYNKNMLYLNDLSRIGG